MVFTKIDSFFKKDCLRKIMALVKTVGKSFEKSKFPQVIVG